MLYQFFLLFFLCSFITKDSKIIGYSKKKFLTTILESTVSIRNIEFVD